jgi:MSHA biogenesis protein MshM
MSLYLDHFGLREAPFRITPHTEFFFTGAIAGRRWMHWSTPLPTTKASSRSAAKSAAARPCSAACCLNGFRKMSKPLYLANPSLSRQTKSSIRFADELGMPARRTATRR